MTTYNFSIIEQSTARALRIIHERRCTSLTRLAQLLWKARVIDAASKAGAHIEKLRRLKLVEGLCSERSPLNLSAAGVIELNLFELGERLVAETRLPPRGVFCDITAMDVNASAGDGAVIEVWSIS